MRLVSALTSKTSMKGITSRKFVNVDWIIKTIEKQVLEGNELISDKGAKTLGWNLI